MDYLVCCLYLFAKKPFTFIFVFCKIPRHYHNYGELRELGGLKGSETEIYPSFCTVEVYAYYEDENQENNSDYIQMRRIPEIKTAFKP